MKALFQKLKLCGSDLFTLSLALPPQGGGDRNKRFRKYEYFNFLILSSLFLLTSCGGATLRTNSAPIQNENVTLNLFSLGTQFPIDLQIPDIDGLRDTAFIVTDSPALGVIPYNLDSQRAFQGLIGLDATAPGIGTMVQYSRRVLILDASHALYLGGAGVVYFNPTTGAVYSSRSLTQAILLNSPLAYSRLGDMNRDGTREDSVSGAFNPSFADSIAVIGNRVFITMSNLFFDSAQGNPGFFTQGLVLVFDLSGNNLVPNATPYLVTTGFNATGLTVYNGKLLVTNTGATLLYQGGQTPLKNSILDEFDPDTLTRTRSLDLGPVVLNDRPLAIWNGGPLAFIGSAAFSKVYEIDLEDFVAVRGLNNPIVISNLSSDFITDQEISEAGSTLFVSSFNNEFVRSIDLTSPTLHLNPEIYNFHIPPTPGLSGAGPIAIRPGTPGVDFLGADLFVLTGNPGTLSAVETY